jgi:uncharacterized protein involved in cysteine biosynthesis
MKIKVLGGLFAFGLLMADVRDYIYYIMSHAPDILKFLKISPAQFPNAPYALLAIAALSALVIFKK